MIKLVQLIPYIKCSVMNLWSSELQNVLTLTSQCDIIS